MVWDFSSRQTVLKQLDLVKLIPKIRNFAVLV